MIVDRYQVVGLRHNPFTVQLGPGDAQALFVDRDLPDPPPAGSSTFVQVIGDMGAGKTTQVLAWRRQNPGPYHYIPRTPRRDRWMAPPVESLVYADEIDRMPRLLRLQWFRRLGKLGATLVAGTHCDLERLARQCGFDVVTHYLGPADLDLMSAVFNRRLAHFSIEPAQGLQLSPADLADVHARSHGSLRGAEHLGHQLVAERVAAEPPTLAHAGPKRSPS